MSTIATPLAREESAALRTGSGLMALASLGFIGYAVLFFVRNLTDSFLELGIGREQVSVGNAQIEAFSPSLHSLATAIFVAGAVVAAKAILKERR